MELQIHIVQQGRHGRCGHEIRQVFPKTPVRSHTVGHVDPGLPVFLTRWGKAVNIELIGVGKELRQVVRQRKVQNDLLPRGHRAAGKLKGVGHRAHGTAHGGMQSQRFHVNPADHVELQHACRRGFAVLKEGVGLGPGPAQQIGPLQHLVNHERQGVCQGVHWRPDGFQDQDAQVGLGKQRRVVAMCLKQVVDHVRRPVPAVLRLVQQENPDGQLVQPRAGAPQPPSCQSAGIQAENALDGRLGQQDKVVTVFRRGNPRHNPAHQVVDQPLGHGRAGNRPVRRPRGDFPAHDIHDARHLCLAHAPAVARTHGPPHPEMLLAVHAQAGPGGPQVKLLVEPHPELAAAKVRLVVLLEKPVGLRTGQDNEPAVVVHALARPAAW